MPAPQPTARMKHIYCNNSNYSSLIRDRMHQQARERLLRRVQCSAPTQRGLLEATHATCAGECITSAELAPTPADPSRDQIAAPS